MTTFYTSDTHFNHKNILKYCPMRKYGTLEEMNRDLIARWNARVTPSDIVFHLGDYAMGDYSQAPLIFKELNGFEKHLVFGNHDREPKRMLAMGWTSVEKSQDLLLPDGRHIFLSHYPQTYVKLDQLGAALQLCGHVHQKWSRARTELRESVPELQHDAYVSGREDPEGRVINVGVDVRDFEPKTLTELLGPK